MIKLRHVVPHSQKNKQTWDLYDEKNDFCFLHYFYCFFHFFNVCGVHVCAHACMWFMGICMWMCVHLCDYVSEGVKT